MLAFQAEVAEREPVHDSPHNRTDQPWGPNMGLDSGAVLLVKRKNFLAIRLETALVAD